MIPKGRRLQQPHALQYRHGRSHRLFQISHRRLQSGQLRRLRQQRPRQRFLRVWGWIGCGHDADRSQQPVLPRRAARRDRPYAGTRKRSQAGAALCVGRGLRFAPPDAGPMKERDLSVTPHEFISKWRSSALKERSASQEHFLDLCRMLGEPTPAEADPSGDVYCFERGARKDTGGDGWADVWKRHHFAWEYKSPGKSLDAAFDQLRQYSLALENPPLLIVCDLQRFRIRTNWTNSVSKTHEFDLEGLADPATRDLLKWAFSDPERLRPGVTRHSLTERAAASFATVAQALRERSHDPPEVARFVNRMVFCMFADDVGLLPDQMFTRMLRQARRNPDHFSDLAGDLFGAMANSGRIGFEEVAWFNGGLFDDSAALPLERSDIDVVLEAAALDWSEIDPSILGTLFERGLDPAKRAQLGAHYTDRDKIMQLVDPAVVEPLLAEWNVEKTAIKDDLDRSERRRVAIREEPASLEGPAADGGLPHPTARVHGARPGLRIGQLPVLGPARPQRPRAPGPT